MARYKYDREGKLLSYDEKTGEWKRDRKAKSRWDFSKPARLTYMADIAEFVSVAGEKPLLVSSRSTLARHERSENMRQVGDDMKGKIVANGLKRQAAEKAAVARAIKIAGDVRWT